MSKKILYSIALLILPVGGVLLSHIFSGAWVLPQVLTLGPLSIHYYGFTMAFAVGSGWWLALRRAPQYFTSPNPLLERGGIGQKNFPVLPLSKGELEGVDSFLLWLVVGGFVGARLYHVASSYGYYVQHPVDMFKVWHGGLSIYGALIGGFVIVLVYSLKTKSVIARSESLGERRGNLNVASSGIASRPIRNVSLRAGVTKLSRNDNPRFNSFLSASWRTHFSFLHLLDWLIPSVVLGQIIGRFGNFFNYEAFGYPTTLPWKMFVPTEFRPAGVMTSAYYHPLFLYEALGNVFIFYILLRLSKTERVAINSPRLVPGALFFVYLFLYNALRFALEHLRMDSTFVYEIFRLNALVSGLLSIIGLVGYLAINYVFNSREN